MGKDLGTYHVRVEFKDGSGFIYRWTTGMRFSHGMDSCHPLNAQPMKPNWEDEEELLHNFEYMFTQGNYSCDCNKRIFLAQARQDDSDQDEACGDTIQLKKLTAIKPDGSEVVLVEIQ